MLVDFHQGLILNKKTMARSYSANEAFSVQARTYPKVWSDGTVADIKKEAAKVAKAAPEEAKEWARGDAKIGFVNDWALLYPAVVPNAVDKAIEIVGKIANDLKAEFPAHTINFGAVGTEMVVKSVEGKKDKEYLLGISFRSPQGKSDVRFYKISNSAADGSNAEPLGKAVTQLVLENGMDRREFIDGESKFIEARRQPDRG